MRPGLTATWAAAVADEGDMIASLVLFTSASTLAVSLAPIIVILLILLHLLLIIIGASRPFIDPGTSYRTPAVEGDIEPPRRVKRRGTLSARRATARQ